MLRFTRLSERGAGISETRPPPHSRAGWVSAPCRRRVFDTTRNPTLAASDMLGYGLRPNPTYALTTTYDSQVVFSQLAAAVDSLCVVPGFGQFGGAVMSRMGIVMMEAGSQTGKSYLGSFLVIPITVSL
jgi:hypothetical protein